MREIRQSGSVEGAAGDRGPYSDHALSPSIVTANITPNITSRCTKQRRKLRVRRSNWRSNDEIAADSSGPIFGRVVEPSTIRTLSVNCLSSVRVVEQKHEARLAGFDPELRTGHVGLRFGRGEVLHSCRIQIGGGAVPNRGPR